MMDQAGTPALPITVSTSTLRTDAVHVAVAGDLDLATIGQLRGTLLDAIAADRPATLRLDLAKVTFCDCSGLGVLVGVHADAAASGTRVVVAAASPMVALLLDLCNIGSLFDYPPPTAVPPAPSDRRWWPWRHILRRTATTSQQPVTS